MWIGIEGNPSVSLVEGSVCFLKGLILSDDEGAPIFTARVDGVVQRHGWHYPSLKTMRCLCSSDLRKSISVSGACSIFTIVPSAIAA